MKYLPTLTAAGMKKDMGKHNLGTSVWNNYTQESSYVQYLAPAVLIATTTVFSFVDIKQTDA